MFKKMKYLAHIVLEKGIETGPSKTDAVKNRKTPSNVYELKASWDCSYYMRFVYKFSDILN